MSNTMLNRKSLANSKLFTLGHSDWNLSAYGGGKLGIKLEKEKEGKKTINCTPNRDRPYTRYSEFQKMRQYSLEAVSSLLCRYF